MKRLFYPVICLLVTSCAPIINYQVLKVKSDNLNEQKDALVFENDQCKVLYNLWEENGSIGFVFFNKTDKTIYIDKPECFFVLNGIANDYFQNRTYTKSSSIGVSSSKGGAYARTSSSETGTSTTFAKSETNLLNALSSGILTTKTIGSSSSYSESMIYSESIYQSQGVSVSKGFSVSYMESPTIAIPPKSFKIINEFNIITKRYKGCDLVDRPARNIQSNSFTESNSPYIFSNRICYRIDSINQDPITIVNNFYVSEISNMPSDKFFYDDYETVCGERSYWKVKFRKFASPECFYIEY